MSDDVGTRACPHCGVDNRVGDLSCSRCGRPLPRSSRELREKISQRLEEERRRLRYLHAAIAIAIGITMAVAVRLIAETVPQDIVGMPILVEFAKYSFWLVGMIWGGFFWLALRSGRD